MAVTTDTVVSPRVEEVVVDMASRVATMTEAETRATSQTPGGKMRELVVDTVMTAEVAVVLAATDSKVVMVEVMVVTASRAVTVAEATVAAATETTVVDPTVAVVEVTVVAVVAVAAIPVVLV